MTENYSNEVKAEALKIAKGTQRPGQTKEQTRLIAQGIEKGIAEYRKNEKSKARERDKARKKQARAKRVEDAAQQTVASDDQKTNVLPWVLLLVSWIGFGLFVFVL